jgi:hypothetical protein
MSIKHDERIQTFLNLVKSGRANIDSKALLDEIQQLHASREIRSLTYHDIAKSSQKVLIQASLQNQSYRSRVVEIKMIATRQYNIVEEHKDKLTRYIFATYKSSITFKTKGERDQYVEHLLEPANSLLSRLSSISEIADMIITDIDQAAWTIKNIITVMDLSSKRENTI